MKSRVQNRRSRSTCVFNARLKALGNQPQVLHDLGVALPPQSQKLHTCIDSALQQALILAMGSSEQHDSRSRLLWGQRLLLQPPDSTDLTFPLLSGYIAFIYDLYIYMIKSFFLIQLFNNYTYVLHINIFEMHMGDPPGSTGQ